MNNSSASDNQEGHAKHPLQVEVDNLNLNLKNENEFSTFSFSPELQKMLKNGSKEHSRYNREELKEVIDKELMI